MLVTRNQSLHEMMFFWVLGISQNFPQKAAGESLKSKFYPTVLNEINLGGGFKYLP